MGKASRAKRQRSQQAAAQQALVDRVKQSLPDARLKIVKRPTGRKVSEILMEFAEPWLAEARNDDQRKAVIGLAVLAWNMAAFPEPERWAGMSPEFAEKFGNPAKAILKEMIARKLALYPEETRSILDYEITGGRDTMRVEVVFSLLPREIADLKQGD
ncbi:hypothetical protein SBV1_2630009 [Verrucomicrobia bacterium]|nr:hypothetical protein SBV1_2630009 [Verrucomicrobiota bacterium]